MKSIALLCGVLGLAALEAPMPPPLPVHPPRGVTVREWNAGPGPQVYTNWTGHVLLVTNLHPMITTDLSLPDGPNKAFLHTNLVTHLFELGIRGDGTVVAREIP